MDDLPVGPELDAAVCKILDIDSSSIACTDFNGNPFPQSDEPFPLSTSDAQAVTHCLPWLRDRLDEVILRWHRPGYCKAHGSSSSLETEFKTGNVPTLAEAICRLVLAVKEAEASNVH